MRDGRRFGTLVSFAPVSERNVQMTLEWTRRERRHDWSVLMDDYESGQPVAYAFEGGDTHTDLLALIAAIAVGPRGGTFLRRRYRLDLELRSTVPDPAFLPLAE